MGPSSESTPSLQTRIRQQEAIAELSQQALETDDLDRLFHDASAVVERTLESDYTAVLELLSGGDELLLRDGLGWRSGVVGSATVPVEEGSQPGATLLSEGPVLVADLRTDDRFSGLELLTGHDVTSGITAVIGSLEEPWGVLGAYTTDRREFADHDATFVKNVANIVATAIDRAEKEARLHDREVQLDLASKAASIGLWTWDIQNDVVTADEYLAEAYGFDPEAATAGAPMEAFYEPIHEDDTEETWERLERAVEETGELDAEYRVRDADGEVMWVVARGEVEYENGEPVRLNGAVTDITERKERERAVRESEERYRNLFTSMTDAYCIIEKVNTPPGEPVDFRYVEANDAFEEHTGISDVVGETLRGIVPVDTQEWVDIYDSVVETGEPVRFERTLVAQGRDLECYAYSIGDSSNGQVGVIFTDITDRKERERELERALDLLEKTERIADVGGWEIDAETEDVFWTDHIFDLLEYEGEEEPPLDEALDVYHEEDRSVVEGAVADAMETGDPFDVEVRFRTAVSGDVRWLRVQGAPEVVDGEVVSIRGAVQDVTERKQREQRLEELIDKLEESNERLEQFAYAASHDLQEPLRMVSSYLQLIERRYADELDEDGEEFIEFAVDGAERMREMIAGLLEYSRVETEGDPFGTVDLDEVLADVLADLQLQIEESDATITADDLPPVEGDASQLRQVFQNLLDNAIEYSDDAPPHITVSAERTDGVGPAATWTISVSDDGVGIPEEAQDRVFQVFQRLHTQDEHAGTGIGLALCRRIVERHGGEIWVDSEPGEGATFSFTLPAASEGDE